jgi:predicted nucleic acid-binding protein
VLEAAIDGRIDLLVPDVVAEELDQVLARKLRFDTRRRREVGELLGQIAAGRPSAQERAPAVTGDPDDDAILAGAVDAGADLLVSGDRKHLLPLGEHRGVTILTPQLLLAELRRGTR